MLVVIPESPASVLYALLVISIATLAVLLARASRRKARIARGLAAIAGPKGWPLLGVLPQFAKNANRLNHYIVRIYVTWLFE